MENSVVLTKPFMNGRSQAVRIPYEFRFRPDEELIVNKVGSTVMITPRSEAKVAFERGLTMFSDDFMADGRPKEASNERRMKEVKF